MSLVPVGPPSARRVARLLVPLGVLLLAQCRHDSPVAIESGAGRVGRPSLAVIPVATTDDAGPGSLRQAIADATPGDVIDLSALSGTIALTSGELLIDKSLTILGPGANVLAVARDATTAFRIFHITGGTVAISGITIRGGEGNPTDPGGSSGGGIRVGPGATLHLSLCTVTANEATGIGFGGGIQLFQATATIDRCTVHGNRAPNGAGITVNTSTATVVNSTVSRNVALDEDGGGGGFMIMTFSSGSVSTLNLIYSTVTENVGTNGGGVRMLGIASEVLNLRSSIIAANFSTAPSVPGDIVDPFPGNTITADHSLVMSGGIPAGNGNLTSADPSLGPLADNGGSTLTHELPTGSPGMDGGDAATCAASPVSGRDQRGQLRPRGIACDMGAFEGVPPVVPGNSAPTAFVGGPYVGVEGSPVQLDFGGTDPDQDPLTYSWDFGNGVSGSGAVLPVFFTWVDDPPGATAAFIVSLTASDPFGAQDTRTTTATIANVAPTVSASLAATTIISGQDAELTGSFTDPGVLDAPWSYAIAWGTGTNTTGTSTPGASIVHTRRYCAVGLYSPSLAVTDKDGDTGTKSLSLTVVPLPVSIVLPGATGLAGEGPGSIPVAVLSTPTLNTPTMVNPATATLGGATGPRVGVTRRNNGTFMTGSQDVDGDGRADMVLQFRRDALIDAGALTPGTTELVLRAQLTDGCTEIEGTAPITVVP